MGPCVVWLPRSIGRLMIMMACRGLTDGWAITPDGYVTDTVVVSLSAPRSDHYLYEHDVHS